MSERTGESIICIDNGIIQCRIANRFPEDQRWNTHKALSMRGSPWSPVPKVKGYHVPLEIHENGELTIPEEKTIEKQEEIISKEEPNMPSVPTTSGHNGVRSHFGLYQKAHGANIRIYRWMLGTPEAKRNEPGWANTNRKIWSESLIGVQDTHYAPNGRRPDG